MADAFQCTHPTMGQTVNSVGNPPSYASHQNGTLLQNEGMLAPDRPLTWTRAALEAYVRFLHFVGRVWGFLGLNSSWTDNGCHVDLLTSAIDVRVLSCGASHRQCNIDVIGASLLCIAPWKVLSHGSARRCLAERVSARRFKTTFIGFGPFMT